MTSCISVHRAHLNRMIILFTYEVIFLFFKIVGHRLIPFPYGEGPSPYSMNQDIVFFPVLGVEINTVRVPDVQTICLVLLRNAISESQPE